MLFQLAQRSRVAVISSLLAVSLLSASCESVRSLTGSPDEPPARPKPATSRPAPLPTPPAALPAPPPAGAPSTPSEPRQEMIKVALLLPLTGRLATLGKSMSDAAQMAMFDIADRRFELLPFDDKGTPEGAADAARAAVGAGAKLILGPLLAASVRSVAPIAAGAGVPVLAFSSDRKVAAQNTFIIGFTPEAEVERVVEYAAENGLRRFAALAPDNAYGAAISDGLRRAASAHGVPIVRIELYDPKTQDFTPVVRRLVGPAAERPPAAPATGAVPLPGSTPPAVPAVPPAAAAPPTTGFDALVLAEGGPQLRSLAATLAAMGIGQPTVQLLGTGKWDEPGIGTEPALIGAWFAAPSPTYREEFEVRYRRTFGQAPPRLATLAYDATALAAVLARGSEAQPFTESALTDPNGFFGRDGLFRLTADGVVDRRLAILRIDRNDTSVIDEAPRSFAAGS